MEWGLDIRHKGLERLEFSCRQWKVDEQGMFRGQYV